MARQEFFPRNVYEGKQNTHQNKGDTERHAIGAEKLWNDALSGSEEKIASYPSANRIDCDQEGERADDSSAPQCKVFPLYAFTHIRESQCNEQDVCRNDKPYVAHKRHVENRNNDSQDKEAALRLLNPSAPICIISPIRDEQDRGSDEHED